MGLFSRKKTEKLSITFTKGIYQINDAWNDNDLYYNQLTDLIKYFVNKEYKSGNILQYLARYFAEVHDVEVLTTNNNDVLFVDSEGEEVYGDDKLYMVSISVNGPTVKEIQAVEYLENWKFFKVLKKLDIILYVSNNRDKCIEKMVSYQRVWTAEKK